MQESPAIDNLVTVSAMFENGGNATHRMLDGHPELLVYPFESQLGTDLVNDHFSSLVPARYRWPEFPLMGSAEQDYQMIWDEELKTLLRTPERSKFRGCGLEMDEQERRRSFVAFLEGKPRTRRNLVLAYFTSTFATWRNLHRSGSERLYLGFCPVQVLDSERFFADFPDGQMIHVARNPFSAYAETKNRPFPLSLSRFALTWSICQQLALTYRDRYPGQFHIVRYEELIRSPEEVLRPLCRKLGLEWSDRCTRASFNGEPLEELFPWGAIRAPSPEADREMRSRLSHPEQEDLRSLTSVGLRLLDYSPSGEI